MPRALALAIAVALIAPAGAVAAPELGVSLKHMGSTNREPEIGDFRAIAPSVGTVMTSLRWYETQRNCKVIRRERYDWDKLDRIETLWQEEGLELVGVLKEGPPCASAKSRGGGAFKTQPKPAYMDEWVEYAAKLAGRYGPTNGGPLTHIEVWSEPDLKTWTTNAAGYTKAFVRVAKAVEAADPQVELITGGVGFCCEPIPFIKDLLRSQALANHADVIAVHTYRPTPQMAIRELRRVRDAIGDRRLWITEHGWSTCPAPSQDRTGKCVTKAKQAELLEDYVTKLGAEPELGIERFYWFSSQDFATKRSARRCRGAHTNFYGFWTNAGNPKPSVSIWEGLTGTELPETIPAYPTVRPCPNL